MATKTTGRRRKTVSRLVDYAGDGSATAPAQGAAGETPCPPLSRPAGSSAAWHRWRRDPGLERCRWAS